MPDATNDELRPKLEEEFASYLEADEEIGPDDDMLDPEHGPHEPEAEDMGASLDDGPDPLSSDIATDGVPDLPFSTVQRLLFRWFREDNPRALLQLFRRISQNDQLMGQVPAATISELYAALHPDRFLEAVKDIQHNMTDTSVRKVGVQSVRAAFASYHGIMADVAAIRRQVRAPMTVSDYSFFLNVARAFGDAVGAEAIWADLRRDRRAPDTTCYNLFLEAKAWAELFFWPWKYRVRVQGYWYPDAIEQREHTGATQLRKKALEKHAEMVRDGIVADEKTFSLFIIAFAREEDLASVSWVLQTAWDIHVPDVLGESGSTAGPVKQYPKDSPLHPGPNLLFAVAHAFCINNEVPAALQLVDYISRQYGIPIPTAVWAELVERTYHGTRLQLTWQGELAVGILPPPAFSNLWDVMTSEAYKVQRTTPMHDYATASMYYRHEPLALFEQARQGIRHYRRSVRAFEAAQRRLQLLEALDARGLRFHVNDVSLETARRRLETARLAHGRDLRMLKRWGRLISVSPRFYCGVNTWYERTYYPNAVAEFRRIMPEKIYYKATGGLVVLEDQIQVHTEQLHPEYDLVTGEPMIEFRSIGD